MSASIPPPSNVDRSGPPLIRFSGVQKAFGPKHVYRDLNLEIWPGEALTIIGGSGQGKSVMLKLLIGLLRADGGVIEFDGRQINLGDEKAYRAVRRRVGMLFQSGAVFDSMTVGGNVAYGLRELGERDPAVIAEKVAEALGLVDLAGYEDRQPASLSSGMKKRVGLARVVAMKPEVILYDEPTTGLDPVTIVKITDLIEHLQDELHVTSIVVTHDMPSAFRISDRIAMIDQGEVIFDGLPTELVASEDPRVRDFVEGNAPDEDEQDLETILKSAG